MNTNQAVAEQAAKAMTEAEIEKEKDDAKHQVKVIDKTSEAQKLVFEKDFYFSYTCEDGKTLEGDFTIKRMSLSAQGKVGVIKARLNNNLFVDPQTELLHAWMAQLQVSIIKHPDWFNVEKLYEMNLLGRLHDEVAKFENSFRRLA